MVAASCKSNCEVDAKLADKYLEICELTLFRWRGTGAVAGTTTAGLALADLCSGHPVLWITAVIGAAVLAITGGAQMAAPAVLAGPRSLSWTMDPQILVDAFRDAKLIGKDETLRLVERACRSGEGWAITIDLPATQKATDVIKNWETLASALAVDEVQLDAELGNHCVTGVTGVTARRRPRHERPPPTGGWCGGW
jgi:S-DNA-T family DNA segregation ATPase FtsK/SpoIIIE